MSRLLLLLACALVQAAPVNAQGPDRIGFQLQAFLDRPHRPGAEVDLFLRGDEAELATVVQEVNGVVKQRMKGLVGARVPVDQVRRLAASPAVQGIEFSLSRGRVLNDSMRVHNRIDLVHAGAAPLPGGFTGEGVLIGIIDSGLDLDHPDFLDAQGNTRVLRYWDQTYPFNAQLTPQPWGYGQAWDSTAINAGLCPAGEQPGFFGHGTTVTGTAAGNGLATGTHTGAAPDAGLIIVSSDFDLPNWKAAVADAVHYIVTEAEALGMPVVINASLGDYLGSHDGLDAAALFIDSLLTAQPGRVMVCASGNSGEFPPYHVEALVDSDTSFTWYTYKPTPNAFGYGVVYFDLWADTADFSGVHYAVGADRVTPSLQFRGNTPFHTMGDHLGQVSSDSLWSLDGNLLGVVDWYAELRGAQVHLEVHLQQPDSSAYRFRFMSTGTGRFDGWGASFFGMSGMVASGLPTVGQFPDIAHYVLPDLAKRTVDSWACSDQVITVANYFNEVAYTDVNGNAQSVPGTEGALVPRSSHGPTRDGRLKPDVAATGDITFTAGPLATLANLIANEPFKVAPGGMHMRNGGTSMASPVVAAAAALYLEKCPRATHLEVRDAIMGTARADAFTGTLPNAQWGHGKLDAFAALVQSNPSMDLSVFGDTVLCAGDSVLVSGPAFMDSYLWSSGDTVKVFYFDQPGPLSLVVVDPSGCIGISDTLQFVQVAPPPAPGISQLGNTLTSTLAPAYQWFFEGTPIGGANDQTYDVGFTGNYFVQITDTNGCTANSDTLFVLFTGVGDAGRGNDLVVRPSPTDGLLFVDLPTGIAGPGEWIVRDATGRTVTAGRWTGAAVVLMLDLGGHAPGTYLVEVRSGEDRWMRRVLLR